MSVIAMLGSSEAEASVQIACAIRLTKRLHTHLTGVLALPDPADALGYVVGPEMIMAGGANYDTLAAAQTKLRERMGRLFAAETAAAGGWLRAELEHQTGSIMAHARCNAALADAFVLPRRASHSAHALNPTFEHILMEARLPLVLAGDQMPERGTCMIAWDGSPQAARSVRMHERLISGFDKVVIAQNADRLEKDVLCSSAASVAALTDWLHDDRIETVHEALDSPVSEALLAAAKAHEASLIVMGAYGHSRIGELLFGGTSRAILNSEQGPALALCH